MSTAPSGPGDAIRAESAHAEPLRANAWGPCYVTAACVGCGLCAAVAPANFGVTFDGAYYGVTYQPNGEHEQRALREAMAACPQQCIHDDGDTDCPKPR